MNKVIEIKHWVVLIVSIIIFASVLLNNALADEYDMYFHEEVEYIFAYGKPFPEGTPFKCKNNKLWKGYNRVNDYTGKAVFCEFKTITRQEYEDLNNVTRTF